MCTNIEHHDAFSKNLLIQTSTPSELLTTQLIKSVVGEIPPGSDVTGIKFAEWTKIHVAAGTKFTMLRDGRPIKVVLLGPVLEKVDDIFPGEIMILINTPLVNFEDGKHKGEQTLSGNLRITELPKGVHITFPKGTIFRVDEDTLTIGETKCFVLD